MNIEENKEKRCGNCRHFAQYYTVARSKFTSVSLGHCKLRRANSKIKKVSEACCPFWEPYIIFETEQSDNIKKQLLEMAKLVKKFAEYFDCTAEKEE